MTYLLGDLLLLSFRSGSSGLLLFKEDLAYCPSSSLRTEKSEQQSGNHLYVLLREPL